MSARHSSLRSFWRDPTMFAGVLFTALLAASVLQDASIVSPRFLTGAASVAVPLVIGAMAVTPAILSGGGGMDLSVGPLMGFVNVLVVTVLVVIALSLSLRRSSEALLRRTKEQGQ